MTLGRREGQPGQDSLGGLGRGDSAGVTGGPCSSYLLGQAAVPHHPRVPSRKNLCLFTTKRIALSYDHCPSGSSPLIRAIYFQLVSCSHS